MRLKKEDIIGQKIIDVLRSDYQYRHNGLTVSVITYILLENNAMLMLDGKPMDPVFEKPIKLESADVVNSTQKEDYQGQEIKAILNGYGHCLVLLKNGKVLLSELIPYKEVHGDVVLTWGPWIFDMEKLGKDNKLDDWFNVGVDDLYDYFSKEPLSKILKRE